MGVLSGSSVTYHTNPVDVLKPGRLKQWSDFRIILLNLDLI